MAIDDKIAAYVKKTEAGDIPKFKDFGKVVLRSLNGDSMYNRVDKIQVADGQAVAPKSHTQNFGKACEPTAADAFDEHHQN